MHPTFVYLFLFNPTKISADSSMIYNNYNGGQFNMEAGVETKTILVSIKFNNETRNFSFRVTLFKLS